MYGGKSVKKRPTRIAFAGGHLASFVCGTRTPEVSGISAPPAKRYRLRGKTKVDSRGRVGEQVLWSADDLEQRLGMQLREELLNPGLGDGWRSMQGYAERCG